VTGLGTKQWQPLLVLLAMSFAALLSTVNSAPKEVGHFYCSVV